MANSTLKVDFSSGSWKHCDDTYEVIGYNEKKRTLMLSKVHRHGIHYYDITATNITRKLSKDKTIKLANHTLDCSKMPGLENV